MRYFIIAGETSGDNYAQRLMEAIEQTDTHAVIHYFAPDSGSAVMGVTDVLLVMGKLLKRLMQCVRAIKAFQPNALLLIDYPSFNLRIARFARYLTLRNGQKIKTFYYIAPKVWASREKRVERLRKWVDHLYLIFPFEKEYFDSKGLPNTYVGNPLLDLMAPVRENTQDSIEAFRQQYRLGPEPILAILPGSRTAEIKFLLPLAAQVVERFPGYQWVVSAIPQSDLLRYEHALGDIPVRVIPGDHYRILKYAEAALVMSGTATLECALLNCPQVVCYGGSKLTIAIARKLIKTKYIALPNLILDKEVVTELIQEDCTPRRMARELARLLEGRQGRRTMLAHYKRLHKLMGTSGATARVAQDIFTQLVGERPRECYKAYVPTPFGQFCISASDGGAITASAYTQEPHPDGYFCYDKLLEREDQAPPVLREAVQQLGEYMEGSRRTFDLPLEPQGTPFQLTVWKEMCTIEYGTTVSYAELARRCGNDKAARAVGQASNANPLALFIPCHRVIGQGGALMGYAGGVERKQKMLCMEKSRAPELSNSLF